MAGASSNEGVACDEEPFRELSVDRLMIGAPAFPPLLDCVALAATSLGVTPWRDWLLGLMSFPRRLLRELRRRRSLLSVRTGGEGRATDGG